MLVGIPSYLVNEIWPHVQPFIERSLDEVHEYRWTADDIRAALADATMQLWVRDSSPTDMVVVTEIYKHPRAVELSVGPIAGTLGERWEDELAQLAEWGRQQGCTHIGTLGRTGWERKLGWRKGAVYCVKEL